MLATPRLLLTPSLSDSWTNHWWKVRIHIPSDWEHHERVQFEFDPGCEAMVFTTDGTPLQGITGGHGGDRRVDHIIPISARKKGVYDMVIESSCDGMLTYLCSFLRLVSDWVSRFKVCSACL